MRIDISSKEKAIFMPKQSNPNNLDGLTMSEMPLIIEVSPLSIGNYKTTSFICPMFYQSVLKRESLSARMTRTTVARRTRVDRA